MFTAASLIGLVLATSTGSPEAVLAPTPAPVDRTGTVKIETRDGVEIRGTFRAPRTTRRKAPGALLVHGAGRDRSDLDALAERLHKQGFGVLSIDLRGHGRSTGDEWDWEAADDAERQRLWAFALRDLEAGALYLESDRRILSTSYVVVGHGAGCALAARHAARDENVRALALLDPPTAALGFDLKADVADLAGLPTMVAVTAPELSTGRELASAGRNANDGQPFIEIAVLRRAKDSVLQDPRLVPGMTKWLEEQTQPKRGR